MGRTRLAVWGSIAGLALSVGWLRLNSSGPPSEVSTRLRGQAFYEPFYVIVPWVTDRAARDALRAGLAETARNVERAFAGSPEDLAAMQTAVAIERATQGAFSTRTGAVRSLWGLSAVPFRRIPSPEEIEQSRLTRVPDLAPIRGGVVVDALAQTVENEGITSYLVVYGLHTRGRGALGEAVTVPRPDYTEQRYAASVRLANRACSTAASYRNAGSRWLEDHSDIVDPRTGFLLPRELRSTTVIHEDGSQAATWSLALHVLGPTKGQALAEELGLAAVFLHVRDDQELVALSTAAFDALRVDP